MNEKTLSANIIHRELFRKDIIRQDRRTGKILPKARRRLAWKPEEQIVEQYNAELQLMYDNYAGAAGRKLLCYAAYLMEYSCLKTLAAKHNSSTRKIIKTHGDGKGRWCVTSKSGEKIYFLQKIKK